MTRADLFMTQLKGLRNQLAGVVDTIDALVALAESPVDEDVKSDGPPPCPHPVALRRPTGTMGHANRFICSLCNQEIELETRSCVSM